MSNFSQLMTFSVTGHSDKTFHPMRLQSVAGMSMAYECEVTASCKVIEIDAKNMLSKTATVVVTLEDGSSRYIHGIISEFFRGPVDTQATNAAGSTETRRVYWFKIVPWTSLLEKNVSTRIFERMSVQDIIETIFNDYSQANYENLANLSNGKNSRLFTAQYEESDWDFINRLLEQEGIYYYFKHSVSGTKLSFGDEVTGYFNLDAAGPLTVKYNSKSEVPERLRVDGAEPYVAESMVDSVMYQSEGLQAVSSDELLVWEHDYQFESGTWATKDYDYLRTSNITYRSAAQSANDQPSWLSKYNHYHFADSYVKAGSGATALNENREVVTEDWPDERASAAEARFNMVFAAGTHRGLSVGGKFKLNSSSASFNSADEGPYAVVYSQLTLDNGQGTDITATESIAISNTLVCIPATQVYRPPLKTPTPQITGIHLGKVVATDGTDSNSSNPDTDPQGLARVRVHFLWQRETPTNQKTANTGWVRVGQVWGGQRYGLSAWPHIGHEVLVGFENGNIDRPVVVGMVYNGQNTPPLSLPDYQEQFVVRDQIGNQIKMRAVPSSPQIEFSSVEATDSSATKVEMLTGAGKSNFTYTLVTENTSSTTVDAGSGQDLSGAATNTATTETTISADTTETVDSNGAGMTIDDEGDAWISVAEDVRFDIDGNFNLYSDGAVVVRTQGYRPEYVGHNYTFTSEGSRTETIGEIPVDVPKSIIDTSHNVAREIVTRGDMKETVNAAGSQLGDRLEDVEGDYDLTVTGTQKLTVGADQIVIENGKKKRDAYSAYFSLSKGWKVSIYGIPSAKFSFSLTSSITSMDIGFRAIYIFFCLFELKFNIVKMEYLYYKTSAELANLNLELMKIDDVDVEPRAIGSHVSSNVADVKSN